jgi:hypothetical protein
MSPPSLQNNVDELFSLFAFLRCRPLDDWDTFREQISKPVKAGRTKYAMKKLQVRSPPPSCFFATSLTLCVHPGHPQGHHAPSPQDSRA